MDREEAQNILQLCRPDSIEDRNDPLIVEAIEQLSQDAELNAWFEAQQALDATISAEFEKIAPAADLKASILAGMRAHAAQAELLIGDAVEEATEEAHAHVLPFPRPANQANHRSTFRPWMGIAAALAVAAVVLLLPVRDASTQLANNDTPGNVATAGIPGLIDFLADEIQAFKQSAPFDKRATEHTELQRYLNETGRPTPGVLPAELEGLNSLGCVTFNFKDCDVSMICFKQDGSIYHLLTTEKDTCPKTYAQQPAIYEHDGKCFKTWSKGEKIFIICTDGAKENLPMAANY
jgi:hypothetical protein